MHKKAKCEQMIILLIRETGHIQLCSVLRQEPHDLGAARIQAEFCPIREILDLPGVEAAGLGNAGIPILLHHTAKMLLIQKPTEVIASQLEDRLTL